MREQDKLEAWLALTDPDATGSTEAEEDTNSTGGAERLEAWLQSETASPATEQSERLEAWLDAAMKDDSAPVPAPPATRTSALGRFPQTGGMMGTTPRLGPKPTQRATADSGPDESANKRSLTAEHYARIKIALWSGTKTIGDIVKESGIKETAFRESEATQMEQLARQLDDPNDEGVEPLHKILRETRSEATTESPPAMAVEPYAALLAQLQSSDDEEGVLRSAGLDAESWQGQRRLFRRAMRGNQKLRGAFRVALERAKQKLETPDGPPCTQRTS
ncbi:MAG: hypothetical protein VB934_00800 [Polyangiaceae bacterium]